MDEILAPTEAAAAESFTFTVREAISAISLWSLLFGISYFVLSRFRKSVRSNEDGSEEDRTEFAFWLTAFAFSVAIAAVLLIPFTVVASVVIARYGHSDYASWLNYEFVFDLWNMVFWGVQLCLYLILPFAYLYMEAVGLRGARGVFARLCETSIQVGLLLLVICGAAYAISNSFGYGSILSIPATISIACGAVALIVAVPNGLVEMNKLAAQLYTPFNIRNSQVTAAEIVRLELEATRMQRNRAQASTETSKLEEQEKLLMAKHQHLLRQLERSPLLRNVLYMVGFGLTRALLVLISTRVFLSRLWRVPSLFTIPAIDVALILYFSLVGIVGLYRTRIGRYAPRLKDTSVQQLIAATALVLVMASSLPVVSPGLGMTSSLLMERYGTTRFMNNQYVLGSYNALFAVALALRLLHSWGLMTVYRLLGRIVKACWNRVQRLRV
eukprot:TRINITY_DN11534_c0_g1_i1.p1 TRINITY_DN11534_c0_g1~~TRINITY_DN11534_c0_g1_i1.p1  ORF type:complete len:442 (-),score=84.87 TRINITY_DN11534_c0_g1_i1:84-1409(-)